MLALVIMPLSAAGAQDVIGEWFARAEEALEKAGGSAATTYESSVTREEALAALFDVPSVDFTLNTLDGESMTLSDLQGKIVIMSIWASWCGPCKNEMPIFEEVNNKYDDLIVLAVHSAPLELGVEKPSALEAKSAEQTCRAFIEENGFTFPVLLDAAGEVSMNSTYITRGIPGNFVIDKEGIIRYRQEGAYIDEESLMMVIDYVRALG